MLFKLLAATAALTSNAIAHPLSCNSSAPQPWGFFTNNTIYQTSGDEGITYPRYTELQDGTIIATASLSGHNPNYFPIFESKDGGASWEHVSDLHDTVNGWGFSAQPALTELTEPMGGYPAGTILGAEIVGVTTGQGSISMLAETAEYYKWRDANLGAVLLYQGQLVAYYSDQRDPLHGQKLAHQTSTDLKTWGPVVNDVAYEEYLARPGMTVVAFIPPLNQWILVHELPIGNSSSYGSNYPVYYVMADSPLNFRNSVGRPIVINNSTVPNASPYVVWSPLGGPNGGALDKWEEHATPAGAVYSRAIQIFKKRPNHLMIYGGETYDDRGTGIHTPFSATVVRLDEVLKAPATE
ncbi:hypothetical protein B0T12DRAFT_517810 [Alternaria alternata]|nr:hypothetical protein B0T12DRAFT_517810 [Alternaria alternata]